LPDLMIAATAELAGVAVLHYDHDFDLIAEVTTHRVDRSARHRRLVPEGLPVV
jgi:predicted nucleic acid-binding protein